MGKVKEPNTRNFYDRWFFDNNPKLQLVDKINDTEYIVGIAEPNTKDTDIGWQITKYIYKDRQTEVYPAKGGSSNLRWTDRLDVFDTNIPIDGSPYDIVLSNYTLVDGTGAGAVVATITTLTSDPTRTHTYTIIDDPNAKFTITGDKLELIGQANLADSAYTIKVETTDDLGRKFQQFLYLVVIAVPVFTDNSSVVFNGIDQYMKADKVGNMFSQENVWSWSVWLDPSDPSSSNGNGFFGIYVDSNNYFSFGFHNGVLTLKHKDNGNETIITWNSDAGLANYTLVMDYTKANTVAEFNVYKNGVAQVQLSNSAPLYNSPNPSYYIGGVLWVGRDTSDPLSFQFLRMNDLSLWNKALSPADSLEIFGAGEPNDLFQHTSDTNLRGWWTFEGSGNDELSINNGNIVNIGPSVFEALPQNYVFINPNRLSDELVGNTTPTYLNNGQVLLEVTTDSDQYLTEYVKYSASTIRGLNLQQADKFQELIDEGKPIPVVIKSDGTPPILQDILITNDVIDSGANVGTVVGSLLAVGGIGPFLYTILDDPDNKFGISNNDLVTSQPIDFALQNAHNVTIRVTDINNEIFDKTFIITVNQVPALPFANDFYVRFNGTNQHAEAAYDVSFSGLNKITIDGWFTPNNISGERVLVSHFGANGKRAFRFAISNGRVFIGISQDGINQENFFGAPIIVAGNTYHITFAFDGVGKTVKTWINGAIDIDSTTTYSNLYDAVNEPLRIGARGDTSFPEVAFFDGFIDEVSINNDAFTALRVQERYNFGVPANVQNMTTSSSLVSSYRMGDGDTYPTLLDLLNTNDLTMYNMLASDIVNFSFQSTHSLTFNGIDEYISTTADYSGLNKLTFGGWFYRATTSQRLDLSQSNNANTNRIKIVRNANGSIYIVLDGVAVQFVSNSTGWEHIILVFDGTAINADRLKLYRNGVQLSPVATPAVPTVISNIPNTFNIGKDDGSGTFSDGNLDEICVFGDVLNATEITEWYNSGVVLDMQGHSKSASILNYWRCGEFLTATTMPDQVGGDVGTLVNMDLTNKDTNIP